MFLGVQNRKEVVDYITYEVVMWVFDRNVYVQIKRRLRNVTRQR